MKRKIVSILESCGHKNVELTYNKSEGWWLRSDKFDNWLAMDSYGTFLRVKNYEVLIKSGKNINAEL